MAAARKRKSEAWGDETEDEETRRRAKEDQDEQQTHWSSCWCSRRDLEGGGVQRGARRLRSVSGLSALVEEAGAGPDRFREKCSALGFDLAHILPHGSYLMNCGDDVSRCLLVDELSRCSRLGLRLYNFHPGSSLGAISTQQCLDNIAAAINHAHQQTPAVVTGHDLAADGGVAAMLDQFDQEVGLRYLRAVHLNDSKGKLGCNLDRHEDIGKGNIGLSAFRDVVNEPRLDGVPLILETPGRPGFQGAEQIELLYSLCEEHKE